MSTVWTLRLAVANVLRVAPPHEQQRALGTAIRQHRARSGVTQENLAHDAGITTGTLSQIERGVSNPTWATVKSIARALGVSLSALAKAAERLDDD